MIVNPVDYTMSNVNTIKPRALNGEAASTDKLFRNNGDGTFTDVSREAGILIEGYSLGVATGDINGDGWTDIYVSNDFLTNDILYLNNGDGTFSNRAADYLNHTSFAGMGSDISDVNNDGRLDIMVVDMLPEDHYRRQMIIPASSYDRFELTQTYGYEKQYTRNTLQLNNGQNREGDPLKFSEIGQLAGIDQTDWSWASLFADFDNDGDRDLLITNGFFRDVGNLDYISYQRENNTPFGSKQEQYQQRLKDIQELGDVKIPNYIFENTASAQSIPIFQKRNKDWGMGQPSCSNGAAFADLDNDGDLDLVINNVNDEAFLYENKSNTFADRNHYIKLKLNGPDGNHQGIGAKLTLFAGGQQQYYEHTLYRGYESTVSEEIHFGLGKVEKVDSIVVQWPDNKVQVQREVAVNQTLAITYAATREQSGLRGEKQAALFQEIGASLGLNYQHQQPDFVDFKVQPLLPHKHSQNGPGLAVGDINGDKLDDILIGGSTGYPAQVFVQQADGTFRRESITQDSIYDDMGCLFFDVEGDGDLDLYVVSGGSRFPPHLGRYQDRLYLNNGAGQFALAEEGVIPEISASGSCVIANDYDQDGDLDLFIGGRILPGSYPMSPRSYLLRNDTKDGQVQFKDATPEELAEVGMVTAALWTDTDNDKWADLLLVGEFMPVTIFKNTRGRFTYTSIPDSEGWWNSLGSGDFDKDGDVDYVLGNLGLNSRYKTSVEEPLCVYAADYDKNGRIDPILCQYIMGERYITHPRGELIEQINAMRVRFKKYEDYATRTFDRSFLPEEIESAHILKTATFASVLLKNGGDGTFELAPLPIEAQTAPLFGMLADDFDGDGNLDVLAVGNSYASEVSHGDYDAFKGLLLAGDGQGNFAPRPYATSGFWVDLDAKGMARVRLADGRSVTIVSSNQGDLKTFAGSNSGVQVFPLGMDAAYALLTYPNGKVEKREFYFGQTYLSQSSRVLEVAEGVEVTIMNNK